MFTDKIHGGKHVPALVKKQAVRHQSVFHAENKISLFTKIGTEITVKFLAANNKAAAVHIHNHGKLLPAGLAGTVNIQPVGRQSV